MAQIAVSGARGLQVIPAAGRNSPSNIVENREDYLRLNKLNEYNQLWLRSVGGDAKEIQINLLFSHDPSIQFEVVDRPNRSCSVSGRVGSLHIVA